MNILMPAQIKAESFAAYPPQARALLIEKLDLLRRLPLILLPLLLREAIVYDWRFPAERRELEEQLAYLASLTPPELDGLMDEFKRLTLNDDLVRSDWVGAPNAFSEKLTAHLWATHQMDSFREAAERYAHAWQAQRTRVSPAVSRMTIAVVGKGVTTTDYPLFRKLRSHGVYFTQVSPRDGLSTLLSAVGARAASHSIPYAHWYIDGGEPEPVTPAVTAVSYGALQSARAALLNRMQSVIQSGSSGPEELRSVLAQLKPQEIGLPASEDTAVLSHFQLNVLTEGSGTQIFATTFAQWAAREALRRAQPVTLLVRFAPRQRQLPMNELLSNAHPAPELDPDGSLIDADMAAYYTWLNQQRLPGSDKAGFLAWFEGYNEAVAIGPSLPRGTTSASPTTLQQMLNLLV
jgi:hypothetical protein